MNTLWVWSTIAIFILGLCVPATVPRAVPPDVEPVYTAPLPSATFAFLPLASYLLIVPLVYLITRLVARIRNSRFAHRARGKLGLRNSVELLPTSVSSTSHHRLTTPLHSPDPVHHDFDDTPTRPHPQGMLLGVFPGSSNVTSTPGLVLPRASSLDRLPSLGAPAPLHRTTTSPSFVRAPKPLALPSNRPSSSPFKFSLFPRATHRRSKSLGGVPIRHAPPHSPVYPYPYSPLPTHPKSSPPTPLSQSQTMLIDFTSPSPASAAAPIPAPVASISLSLSTTSTSSDLGTPKLAHTVPIYASHPLPISPSTSTGTGNASPWEFTLTADDIPLAPMPMHKLPSATPLTAADAAPPITPPWVLVHPSPQQPELELMSFASPPATPAPPAAQQQDQEAALIDLSRSPSPSMEKRESRKKSEEGRGERASEEESSAWADDAEGMWSVPAPVPVSRGRSPARVRDKEQDLIRFDEGASESGDIAADAEPSLLGHPASEPEGGVSEPETELVHPTIYIEVVQVLHLEDGANPWADAVEIAGSDRGQGGGVEEEEKDVNKSVEKEDQEDAQEVEKTQEMQDGDEAEEDADITLVGFELAPRDDKAPVAEPEKVLFADVQEEVQAKLMQALLEEEQVEPLEVEQQHREETPKEEKQINDTNDTHHDIHEFTIPQQEQDLAVPLITISPSPSPVPQDQEYQDPEGDAAGEADTYPDPPLLPLIITAIPPTASHDEKSALEDHCHPAQTPTPPASPPPTPLRRTVPLLAVAMSRSSSSGSGSGAASPKTGAARELLGSFPAAADTLSARPAWSIRASDAPALGLGAGPGLSAGGMARVKSREDLRRRKDLAEVAVGEEVKELVEEVKELMREAEVKGKEVAPVEEDKPEVAQVRQEGEEDPAPHAPPVKLSTSLPGSFPDAPPPTIPPAPIKEDALASAPAPGSIAPATLRRRRAPRSALDIALAMQLRPGLGLGADPAWMVRFLMAMFGWFAVLVSGGGEFDGYVRERVGGYLQD